jgi:beta-lactamase class A
MIPGVAEYRADLVMPLASVGKLLLLAEVARRMSDGTLCPDAIVAVADADVCGGSGLIAGLSSRSWTVRDLALLTASVSDNTATNALIRLVGVEGVNIGAHRLGLRDTRLLDRIREPRLASHPPAFALGTARELACLASMIGGGEPWARLVLGWMASCADRSMVPALIPHDPEDGSVPAMPLEGLWVANKTGTDVGTRCDVGIVRGRRQAAYAVLASCAPGGEFEMVRAMRAFGPDIVAYVS